MSEAGRRYSWNKFSTANNYVNNTPYFQVIAGFDFNGFSPAGDTMTIKDGPASSIIDGIFTTNFGVAASEITISLPRRMLVPPGGIVQSTVAASGEMITCYDTPDGKTSLENALAIL